ncbi:MAG: flagellar basal-body MS-ring/collar protein FliF [Hydrogenophaga sp.]
MSTATATMNPGMAMGNAPAGSTALSTTSGNLPATTGGSEAPVALSMQDQIRKIVTQPAVRKALPAIVTLFVLIIFGLTYGWMQSTPYRPVMPGLSAADQQEALEALKAANFSPQIDPTNGQLSVPQNRYHEARIYLSGQGIPKSVPTGIEALRDQSAMTTSQFMEQAQFNAATEQELARTIMQIGTIQSARVHLALPKQSVFVRDRTPPKASVVIGTHAGRMVSKPQVDAIVHLVSSSVPYLLPGDVTVVDTYGNLMTQNPTEKELGLTSMQAEHKQGLEDLYRNRILQILSPVVGEPNVRSQVNLVLDYTQVESTTEDYDSAGKGPKTRSEVLAEEREVKRNAEGIPGALSNTAPEQPAATTETAVDEAKGLSEAGQTLSSRTTRNFEIDRVVRHVKNPTGNVQRLSVAVVLNERPAPPPADGSDPAPDAPKTIPYTPEELQRLQELVRGVVGFNEARGDVVSVVPARFEPVVEINTVPWYTEDAVHSGIKNGLLGLAFIVFMLVVIRPLMHIVTGADKRAAEAEAAKTKVPDGELTEEDMRMIQIGEGETLEDIKAKLKPKKSSISADMLDTANTYDDKVALIRMLVAEDSGRVANVLKNMIKVG